MRKLFLLTLMPGSGWVEGKSRSEQPGWRAHADFMNELAVGGFVLLGGPISDTEALLVIDATDEAEVHKVFSDDPWHISKTLAAKGIREWTICWSMDKTIRLKLECGNYEDSIDRLRSDG